MSVFSPGPSEKKGSELESGSGQSSTANAKFRPLKTTKKNPCVQLTEICDRLHRHRSVSISEPWKRFLHSPKAGGDNVLIFLAPLSEADPDGNGAKLRPFSGI
jgi:hypothetical protein